MPFSRNLPNPGLELRSPALQVDSLPAEPPGKPKNTGVGSMSLLQGIFPTQKSNWGLLHCRQILYQLSHQGSQVEDGAGLSLPYSQGRKKNFLADPGSRVSKQAVLMCCLPVPLMSPVTEAA